MIDLEFIKTLDLIKLSELSRACGKSRAWLNTKMNRKTELTVTEAELIQGKLNEMAFAILRKSGAMSVDMGAGISQSVEIIDNQTGIGGKQIVIK